MGKGKPGFDCDRLALAIDKSFEAVVRPELWPTVFQNFADATASAGLLIGRYGGTDKGYGLCSPSAEAYLDDYVRKGWCTRNPRISKGRLVGEKSIVSDVDVGTDIRNDTDKAWRDFLKRHGLGWFAATEFFASDDLRFLISLERSGQSNPFQRDELAIVDHGMAHLRRALSLAPALDDSASRGLLSGLESTGQPAALLDRSGRVIVCNRLAESHIGKTLLMRDGHFYVLDRGTNLRLQQFIASVTRVGRPSEADPIESVVIKQHLERPLVVRGGPVASVTSAFFNKASAYITFTTLGATTTVDPEIIQDAFGLTAAELRVALAIANDLDVREIAEAQGVSLATVRAHLKAIFAKTDTRRQASLAMLINSVRAPGSPGPSGA